MGDSIWEIIKIPISFAGGIISKIIYDRAKKKEDQKILCNQLHDEIRAMYSNLESLRFLNGEDLKQEKALNLEKIEDNYYFDDFSIPIYNKNDSVYTKKQDILYTLDEYYREDIKNFYSEVNQIEHLRDNIYNRLNEGTIENSEIISKLLQMKDWADLAFEGYSKLLDDLKGGPFSLRKE